MQSSSSPMTVQRFLCIVDRPTGKIFLHIGHFFYSFQMIYKLIHFGPKICQIYQTLLRKVRLNLPTLHSKSRIDCCQSPMKSDHLQPFADLMVFLGFLVFISKDSQNFYCFWLKSFDCFVEFVDLLYTQDQLKRLQIGESQLIMWLIFCEELFFLGEKTQSCLDFGQFPVVIVESQRIRTHDQIQISFTAQLTKLFHYFTQRFNLLRQRYAENAQSYRLMTTFQSVQRIENPSIFIKILMDVIHSHFDLFRSIKKQ